MFKPESVKANPTTYERIILDFIDPAVVKAVYDIGVGPKTEYKVIKDSFKDTSFFGIEAYPPTYEKIKDNFPGQILNMAVTELGGGSDVEFNVHEDNLMASGLIPYENFSKQSKIKVPSISLDEFDKLFDEQQGILLWMDIEGYELDALKGGSKLLRSGRVKLMNLEVRSSWNGKPSACTEPQIDEYLKSFGFRKIFVYNHYVTSHHHDAIYASADYVLPAKSIGLIERYDYLMGKLRSEDGMLDIALGLLDASIAIDEHVDKVLYLRAKLKQLEPGGVA